MEKYFLAHLSPAPELDAGNTILFQIKAFGGKINGTCNVLDKNDYTLCSKWLTLIWVGFWGVRFEVGGGGD